MSQVSSFLKAEVSKYKDIDHILKKLEDDGEIQGIYDVFKALFDNEFKFTIQELCRIQEAKRESLNIKRQCENNLTLFKNNLSLIVDLIIDKALKNTLTENRTKFEEAPETAAYTEEATPETAVLTANVSTISPLQKKKPTRRSRSRERAATAKDPAWNISMETKGSYRERKSQFSTLSTSKIDSPITHLLNTTTSPGRRELRTPTREKQNTEAGQIAPAMSSAYSSRASLQQPTEFANPNSPLFVQSEFNYIRGSVKFSRSPRKELDHPDLNPGPGAYPVKSSIKQSPSPQIGRAAKVCWFDTIAQNDSPGPHLNPSKHFCSK